MKDVKKLITYPLDKIWSPTAFFSSGVGMATQFSNMIDSRLSLLSTFPCKYICWRSL